MTSVFKSILPFVIQALNQGKLLSLVFTHFICGYLVLVQPARASALAPCCDIVGEHTHSGTQVGGGVDYIFVVDVTASMRERDAPGSKTRWEELHPKLTENVARIQAGRGDRLHLLVFGDKMSAPIQWSAVGQVDPSIPASKSAAFVFEPTTEEIKQRMIKSIGAMQEPNGSYTAIFEAMKVAFERALALKATGSKKIVLAVFTDGADTVASKNRMKEVRDFIETAMSSLGETLVGQKYLFVRVAGANVSPPTAKGFTVADLTPSIANIHVGPESITLPEGLAVKEKSSAVEIEFEANGLPQDQSLAVYFESDPGSPRLQVICANCGKPPVWSKSGVYKVVFNRLGSAEQYLKAFEGRLKVDSRGIGGPGLVLNDLSTKGVRVLFPGALSEPMSLSLIKPASPSKILLGKELRFEAPVRTGAKYHWTFKGADTAKSEETSFVRTFAKAGMVDVELKVEQPGALVPDVNLKVEVIDPALRIVSNPLRPVAGEKVVLTLRGNPSAPIKRVQWLPVPLEQKMDQSATYVFPQPGDTVVSAIAETEFGQASTDARISVGPGLTPPELVSPATESDSQGLPVFQMYRISDATVLKAQVGEGTGRVRFVIEQGGLKIFDKESSPQLVGSDRIASVEVSGASLKAGAARLILTSLSQDAAVTARVGVQKSEYGINVNSAGLSLVKLEPLSGEIEWNRPATYFAQIAGPRIDKATDIEWSVAVVGKDGSRIALPGRTQPASEWRKSSDGRSAIAKFDFKADSSNPRLETLNRSASLEIKAVALGEPAVVEGVQAVWSGMSPKFAPALFIIESPRQVTLDQKITLRVRDQFGGVTPKSVKWEVVGEQANPLQGQSGPEQEFVVAQTGPHTIRASVEWAGGNQVCAEQSFYSDYEPVSISGLTWEGGQDPIILGRKRLENDTVKIKANLRGTRALLDFDVRNVINGTLSGSAPGYPRRVNADDLRKGVAVAFPSFSGSKNGEYSVSLRPAGLDAHGRPVELPSVSFRMVNRPPRSWLLIITLTLAFLLLAKLIYHCCSGNEGRFYQFTAIQSRQAIRMAIQDTNSIIKQQKADEKPEKFCEALNTALQKQESMALVSLVKGEHLWEISSLFSKDYRVPLYKLGVSDLYLPSKPPDWVDIIGKVGSEGGFIVFNRSDGAWTMNPDVFSAKSNKPIDEKIRIRDLAALAAAALPGLPNPDIVKDVYQLGKDGAPADFIWLLLWDYSSSSSARTWIKKQKTIGYVCIIVLSLVYAEMIQKFFL